MPINKRSTKIAALAASKGALSSIASCRPNFYGDRKDLIDHVDLILGSIEEGNTNLKNEGISVLDELYKVGAITGKGHERIYKRFLI